MSIFKSTQVVPVVVADLASVAQVVAREYEDRGYTVHVASQEPGCQEIGITQGGLFKSVLGLKTALRLRIETVGGATRIDAGIGLLESQAVPTAVTMLVFWPALVTQSWGLVQQHKLDQEAVAMIEAALRKAAAGSAHFCNQCGAKVEAGARFCSHCGQTLESEEDE